MWLFIALAACLHFDVGLAAETLTPGNCTLPASSPLYFSDDCKLLCRPAVWSDILLFYLGNYVAHAATTKLPPGSSIYSSCFSIVAALLFPPAGVYNGLKAILSGAIFARTELQTAAKAGAIYAVYGHLPRPRQGSRPLVRSLTTGSSSRDDVPFPLEAQKITKRHVVMNITCRKIHGRISLPQGWYLAPVRSDTTFENDEPGPSGILEPFKAPFRRPDVRRIRLANSYSAVKSIIAIIQACFSITTLYQSRGTQIDQFGYAAFGLTVAPYSFMSIVNLIGNLIRPEYPAVYIVENLELDRMRELVAAAGSQDFFVEGTVGRISEASEQRLLDDLEEGIEEDIEEDEAERRGSLQHVDAIREAEDVGNTHEDRDGRLRETNEVEKTKPKESIQDRKVKSSWFRSSHSARILIMKYARLARADFAILVLPVVIMALTAVVPISIIGGLSGFNKGQSTHAQRIWTMTWLAFGIFGAGFNMDSSLDPNLYAMGKITIPLTLYVAIYSVPAIGGFVVVGQMISQFGKCISVQ